MDFAVIINVQVFSFFYIFIKEDGKFLDLTRVSTKLKLRSDLGTPLCIRYCYEVIIADIVVCKTVAIVGKYLSCCLKTQTNSGS